MRWEFKIIIIFICFSKRLMEYLHQNIRHADAPRKKTLCDPANGTWGICNMDELIRAIRQYK